jgi:putative ABC transport system permease protein
MLRAAVKSLLARKLRLALSAFAIVLGVAFVAGSYVFTDTLDQTFDEIFAETTPDIVVRPAQTGAVSLEFTGGDSRILQPVLVDELTAVDGVDRVDGFVESQSAFVVGADGDLVGGNGPPGIGTNWTDAPAQDGSVPLRLVAGRQPMRSGEVVLDVKTADQAGYRVDDRVTLITAGDPPQVTATMVGTAEFGGGASLAGATLALFDTATAQELFLGGEDAYTSIAVTASDDAGIRQVRDRIQEVLPEGVEARTADEVTAETAESLEEALGFFNTFLLVFAAVALLVGIFLILNTFSILVAQRTQEMALYRALGASRRQVTRAVLLEALAVGIVGSTLGLLLGLGVAQLLKIAFGLFGLDLGGGAGLVMRPRTVLVGYAVGIIVTTIAAYVPARRAARVPPVAAMREDVAFAPPSRRRHAGLGAGLTAAGTAAMVGGLFFDVPQAGWLVGAGIVGVFVGIAFLAPVIGPPIVAVIAAGFPRFFGTVGRLARENAQRNPRRTAATASALMIGLALVAAISVLGQSTNKSIDKALDDGLDAEFVVSNPIGQPFSPAIADRIAELDGVDEVAQVRYNGAQVDGGDVSLAAFEPAAFSRAVDFDVSDGELTLGSGEVLVSDTYAAEHQLSVGDSVTMTLATGELPLEVTGLYPQGQTFNEMAVGLGTLAAAGIRPADSLVYVIAEPDTDLAAVRQGIAEVTDELPLVAVKDQEEFKEDQRAQVNQLLFLVYALLGLAIIIAVLGIVNTLALSVFERTREIGLLRAVGLSRQQLRRMIRLEATAIAVLGAVLGVGLGVVFGIALQRSQAGEGLEVLAVPWLQLVIFVLLSGLVGVLAALWPAYRAARLDVLRAITTE